MITGAIPTRDRDIPTSPPYHYSGQKVYDCNEVLDDVEYLQEDFDEEAQTLATEIPIERRTDGKQWEEQHLDKVPFYHKETRTYLATFNTDRCLEKSSCLNNRFSPFPFT